MITGAVPANPYLAPEQLSSRTRFSGADPGFPVGGVPTLEEGRASIKICQIFRKTAWN